MIKPEPETADLDSCPKMFVVEMDVLTPTTCWQAKSYISELDKAFPVTPEAGELELSELAVGEPRVT